ncbi:MAG TPA: glycosyltransferase family 2 protein [Longilinea sp.]|nr:glycosyltransferase family 2 protein [Longilinea sp.]
MTFSSEVTVIITTYNREKLLRRAIDSVLAQTYPNWELVIVDDASTDGTSDLVKKYTDKRIRYIRHPENSGSSASLNTGILSAVTPYICILDSDDEYLPTHLEKHINLIKSSPLEPGMVYCRIGEKQADGSLKPAHFNLIRGQAYKQALWQGYLAQMASMLIKRECFQKVGMFDTLFPCFKDDDICFRIAKEYRVDFIPEILVIINRDAPSQLTRDPKKYAIGWYYLLEKHGADILTECGIDRLSRHYVRAGWLFLKAHQVSKSMSALKKAYQLYRNPFKFITAIFNGVKEKLFKSRSEVNLTDAD